MQWLIAPAVILIFCLAYILWRRRSIKKLRTFLRNIWGKASALRLADVEQIDDISQYYKSLIQVEPPQRQTDDTTWRDLDMDLVFSSIDSSRSIVGSEVLYAILHEQGRAQDELDRLDALSATFVDCERVREDVQLALQSIGYNAFHGASRYLFQARYQFPDRRWIYYVLGALPTIFIILGFVSSIFFLFAALAFLLNIVVYNITRSQWEKELIALRHIGAVLRCAQKLCKIQAPQLTSELEEMKTLSNQLRAIRFWLPLFGMEQVHDFDIFTIYIKYAFLLDMVSLCNIVDTLNRHSLEIRRLYSLVGRVDACLSIAQLKTRDECWTRPVFNEKNEVSVQGLCHPLIKESVANNYHWNSNLLISGANASGKSTFIKAMAINMILAQTLNICRAQKLCMRRGTVMSSMAIKDSVTAGESYFIAEIKSLRRIMEAGEHSDMVYGFIDEILRGTNTVERIAASASVLININRFNMLCMVATHDIELTELLKDSFENVHFTETVDEDGIRFDYLLRQGPATSRNAIRLLESMAYDQDLVKMAYKLCESYEKSGKWSLS